MICCGKLFLSDTAATGNAWSPYVESPVQGVRETVYETKRDPDAFETQTLLHNGCVVGFA